MADSRFGLTLTGTDVMECRVGPIGMKAEVSTWKRGSALQSLHRRGRRAQAKAGE